MFSTNGIGFFILSAFIPSKTLLVVLAAFIAWSALANVIICKIIKINNCAGFCIKSVAVSLFTQIFVLLQIMIILGAINFEFFFRAVPPLWLNVLLFSLTIVFCCVANFFLIRKSVSRHIDDEQRLRLYSLLYSVFCGAVFFLTNSLVNGI